MVFERELILPAACQLLLLWRRRARAGFGKLIVQERVT